VPGLKTTSETESLVPSNE